ncbi:MAG: response regulator transcription factor [Gemmatimonadota bacterium]|nr:response regulator transcription factor [Gemmatimonadota bacterium]
MIAGDARILIVEDNRNLALGIRRALETEGYDVVHLVRGDDALAVLGRDRFDLVMLDLMLPGAGGFEVLRGLRDGDDATPVLVLSARGEELDKIQGFRLGADDYVVKPVGVLELLFRVRAILRRTGHTAFHEPEHYRFGDVEVDEGARTVMRRGEPVELSRLEFDLLASLLRAAGNVVSRDRLLREVWGIARPDRIRTRTIDTHVSALRNKLEEEPANPRHILTVRKVGYRLSP